VGSGDGGRRRLSMSRVRVGERHITMTNFFLAVGFRIGRDLSIAARSGAAYFPVI
jgi:hypothetical protein